MFERIRKIDQLFLAGWDVVGVVEAVSAVAVEDVAELESVCRGISPVGSERARISLQSSTERAGGF